MAVFTGPGVNDPPIRTPIAEIVNRFGAAYADSPIDFSRYELAMDPAWVRFFAELIRAIEAGSTPTTGDLYVELTPAATVTPTLELAEENGTFQILLDRATTTIAAATLDGAYPPAGYRFTLMLVNDGTAGRLKVWGAAYLGVSADDGSGDADAINVFSFITLPAGGGFVLSTPYSTVEA